MSNLLKAIINIYNCKVYNTGKHYKSKNRANNMGDALEHFVKDSFANSFDMDEEEATIAHNATFSYLGNQNNPPDIILKNGDAIEVKKIESNDSSLALNSSYPKAKLFADSPMIKKACKTCEEWTVKDMIYAVGVVDDNNIKSLALVYGDDYCAEKSVYEQIKTVIKTGVESISGVEFSETKELGRVNRVDPLGITYLRVRGMWGIENPFSVFDYVYKRDYSKKFNFMALINNEKFYSFDNYSTLEKLCGSMDGLNITNVKIKNPNNPAQLKEAKLITYTV